MYIINTKVMSWICKQCETVNLDDALECEVCDAVPPYLSQFDYDEIDNDKHTTLRWKAEYCDSIKLSYIGHETDVTHLNATRILAHSNTEVSFILENNVAKREFTYEIREEKLLKEPKINSFNCGKVDGVVFRNLDTEITWECENFNFISINGVEIPVNETNYYTKFPNDAEIKLCLKNGPHRIEQSKRIKVVDAPQIKFDSNKTKLKKIDDDIETLILNWRVENASSVSVLCDGKVLSTAMSSDNYETNPSNDSVYELIAIGLDNKTEFRDTIEVSIREPAKVEFSSDKMYTLPGVPITISWNLVRANNIKLNGQVVSNKGEATFSPKKGKVYKLTFEDEFGKQSRELKVKMLPLPIIETILVETPKIDATVNVQIPDLIPPNTLKIPDIQLSFSDLNMIEISNIEESETILKLPAKYRTKLVKRISNFLKRIFTKNI